jgi:hypothetical protein
MYMDNFILKLAIRWLPASDALAACCVSREWQRNFSAESDNGDVWKQVCLNTNPYAVEAILKQNDPEMNYRRLAVSFGRGMPTGPPHLSPPTMSLDQVFAVVELYRRSDSENGAKRRRVIEASWVCPIEFSDSSTHNMKMPPTDRKMVVHGANPYSVKHRNTGRVKEWETSRTLHSQKSPLHFAAYDAVGLDLEGKNIPSRALRAKVTLFRRDTMQSVCIMDEDSMDCATGGDSDPAEEVVRFHFHSKSSLKFANNEAGENARALAEHRIFSRFCLNGEFYLKATLPEPDSDEEDVWLANSRNVARATHVEDQVYTPSAQERASLSCIPSFEYEVKRFNFTFRVSTDMPFDFWDEFDIEEDMVIAIEGLRWQ